MESVTQYNQSLPDHRQFNLYEDKVIDGIRKRVKKLVATPVQENNPNYTRGQICHVGQLIHHTSLQDDTEELVTLKLNDSYHGQTIYCENNSDVFTYAKGIVNNIHFDIASPIISVESALDHDINIMVSNSVVKAIPNFQSNGSKWLNFIIIVHGKKANEYFKLAFQIKNFNFRTKVLYIERFNIFISGRDLKEIQHAIIKHQEDLFKKRSNYREQPSLNLRFISSDIETNHEFIHFDINGLKGTTLIERSLDEGSFIIYESANNERKIIPVENFTFFKDSVVIKWTDDFDDEIVLCYDDNINRLRTSVAHARVGKLSVKELTNSYIEKLNLKMEKMGVCETTLKKKVDALEAQNQSLNLKISKLEHDSNTNSNTNKINELIKESQSKSTIDKLTKEIEDLKKEDTARKEELKYKTAEKSAKASMLSDTVKIVGATIAAVGTIKTVVSALINMNQKDGGETTKKIISTIGSSKSMLFGGLFLLGCGVVTLVSNLFSGHQHESS